MNTLAFGQHLLNERLENAFIHLEGRWIDARDSQIDNDADP